MQTKTEFSDRMRMTFIKIPMMDKNAEDCKTTLERWIYILKNMETMEAMPQSFMKEPVFRRLGKVAQYAALDEKDRRAYNESLKAYRDAYAIFKTEREEGRALGLEEGLAEGRAEGLAEGKAQEKIQIARNLLEAGMNPQMISSVTGLTEREISGLLH